MYHFIYITNIPSFYKINLFNRIAKERRILVIFTGDNEIKRNDDFFVGKREFEFISIENKSNFKKVLFLVRLLKATMYANLIICGWSQLVFWVVAMLGKKKKNSVVIESSIFECKTNGLKGVIKRVFLSRISRAYCSGNSQVSILKKLQFKGEIKITKGVGIFNIVKQPLFIKKEKVCDFVYVGRFSQEKNLMFLVKTFNDFPDLNLHLIGFGSEEKNLKEIANNNIIFHGAIANNKLSKLLQNMHVLILPSLSEPWGLVVEEALNNGLPVILSSNVGCSTEVIQEGKHGLIFNLNNSESLSLAIEKMVNIDYYNKLRKNVSLLDFDLIATQQVKCYF